MKRIEGNYFVTYYTLNDLDQKITVPTSIFTTINDSKFNDYRYGFPESLDESFKYFAFGNYLRLKRNSSEATFQFKIEATNSDSLVLKQLDRSRRIIYKRIPDSLKSESKTIDLNNKSFQLKSGEFVDSVYFDSPYMMIKNSNFASYMHKTEKWIPAGYEMIEKNGYVILLSDSSLFIFKEIEGRTNLYKFGDGNEILKIEMKEIEINLELVKQIVERYKGQSH